MNCEKVRTKDKVRPGESISRDLIQPGEPLYCIVNLRGWEKTMNCKLQIRSSALFILISLQFSNETAFKISLIFWRMFFLFLLSFLSCQIYHLIYESFENSVYRLSIDNRADKDDLERRYVILRAIMEVVSLNDLNIKSLCSIFTYIILLNLIIFISVINRILRSNLSYSEKKTARDSNQKSDYNFSNFQLIIGG